MSNDNQLVEANTSNSLLDANQSGVPTKRGFNSEYTKRAMLLWAQPKVNNMEEFNVRVKEYFEYCVQTDYKPSVEGLSCALGIDRRTFYCWSVGQRVPFGEGEELMEACQHAKSVLNTLLTDFMQNGKINPVTGIFLLKNNFGYTDEVIQVNVDADQNKPKTAAEIAKAIESDIPVD